MLRPRTFYVFVCAFSFALSLSVAHAQYTITDLGAITATGQSRGYAINNFGQITGYGAHNGITRAFLMTPVPTAVTVHLDGYEGDCSSLPLQVEVRSASTGDALLTFSPKMNADGTFNLILTPSTYTLAFKADRSLRRVLTGITVPAGTLAVNLVNGDADGDNEVSLFGFGKLVGAFGKLEGEEGFEPTADFDGDGEISLFDFGILVRNFGEVADD